MSEPFIGEIRIFAGSFAPRGWAFCEGQLLPLDQNTALFSLLGTTYGGDGRTTFGLPNLTERFPLHAGRGQGLTERRLGERGGAGEVALGQDEIPAHTHALSGSVTAMGGTDPGETTRPAGMAWAGAREETPYAGTANAALAPGAALLDLAAQGSGAHENRPPYLAVNFIIALVGLFPSR